MERITLAMQTLANGLFSLSCQVYQPANFHSSIVAGEEHYSYEGFAGVVRTRGKRIQLKERNGRLLFEGGIGLVGQEDRAVRVAELLAIEVNQAIENSLESEARVFARA